MSVRRFNEWLAVRLSGWFATMACFYGFLLLALIPIGWPRALDVVQFISSGVIQLVALPLLAVAAARNARRINDLHEKHDAAHPPEDI